MKLNRLIIILLLLVTTHSVLANELFVAPPKSVNTTSDDFTLARTVTVGSSSDALIQNQQIVDIVHESGGVVDNSFFKRFTLPKILIKRRSNIKGATGENGLQIIVTSKKVMVYYTTSGALIRAMELLREQIQERNGRLIIQGCTITDWVESTDRAPRSSGVLDLTQSGILSPQQLFASLPRARGNASQTYKVVSQRGWVIENSGFDRINPNAKIYSGARYYSLEQLRVLNVQAKKQSVKIALEVELLSDNKFFERETGFQFNTVEGMRFVRELLGEWADGSGIRSFVISGDNHQDKRFLEFLDKMQQLLNIDIIVK